uniref:BHLH domain-containing protein n=1 Tax=Syphacia muris TaxID=451379 RepID=A0A0N5AWA8_9BILA
MTVESDQVCETVPPETCRRLKFTRRLLSASSGGVMLEVGKPLVKSIIRVIPNGGTKKARLFCATSSSATAIGAKLQKTIIIRRSTTSNSILSTNSAVVKRPIIALQSVSRESPVVDSASDLRNQIVDSPHESLSHSELDDYIIDEILSLEDDQMALREGSGSKAQPLSINNDKLTAVSSPRHGACTPHSSRISNNGSPGLASASRSPIGIPINSSFRQVVSSSAPASSIDMESLVRGANIEIGNDSDYRDRRKKDIHNMIERRRRYNINDRIKELGGMLPKHSAEEMKLNKGTILKASCDYIRQLRKEHDMLLRQQQQQARMEQTARIYAERVRELEEQLQKNGISVPPTTQTLPPIPSLNTTPTSQRPIKQEPFDDISPSSSTTPTASSIFLAFLIATITITSSAGFMSQLSDNTAAMAISGINLSMQNRSHENGGLFGSLEYSVDRNIESPSEHSGVTGIDWRRTHLASMPSQQQPLPDLIMEDLTYHSSDPLLQGDPMISAAGGGPSPHTTHISSRMSPDVHWDQANFSPDNPNHNSGLSVYHPTSMDFS